MDVNDLKGLFVEVKARMDGAIEHARREVSGVRTGRASVNILDQVHDQLSSVDQSRCSSESLMCNRNFDAVEPSKARWS